MQFLTFFIPCLFRKEYEIESAYGIKDYLEFEEEAQFVYFDNIMGACDRYPDYKKISSFNKDNKFYKNIKD